MKGYRFKFLVYIISFLAMLSVFQRYFNIFPALSLFNIHGLLTNMFSLCIGALTSLLQKRYDFSGSTFLKNSFIEYMAIVLLLLILKADSNIKYLICPFISAFWILKAVNDQYSKPVGNFLSNGFVVWIGTISYGVYIYHWPASYYFHAQVFVPIWNAIPFDKFGRLEKIRWNPWILSFPLETTLAVVLAHISFKYFEQPILRYKDILFPTEKRIRVLKS